MTLVCGDVLGPYLHPRGRRAIAGGSPRSGVTVLEGPDAMVTAVTRDAVRLGDGRSAERGDDLDRRVRCPGPGCAQRPEHRRLGRLLTDET